MPFRGRNNLVIKAVCAAAGTAAVLAALPGSAMAAYGPPPPPPGTVPGGFSCVITSQTIGPAGGRIGPLRDGALTVSLRIQPGTFTRPVQITTTEPFGTGSCAGGPGIGNGGFPGYTAIGGVGILVQQGGTTVTQRFRPPLTLTIDTPESTHSGLIVVWNGTKFVPAAADEIGGFTEIQVNGSADYAELVPGGRGGGGGLGGFGGFGRGGPLARAHDAAAAESFLLAAGIWPAGQLAPGAGVLTGTRQPTADTSRATRLH